METALQSAAGACAEMPRVMLGTGIHKYTLKYKHFEMYPEYFDTEADTDGYIYY